MGHLRFLKKVSAIRRCPLYRVFDIFGKKIIIYENLIYLAHNFIEKLDKWNDVKVQKSMK